MTTSLLLALVLSASSARPPAREVVVPVPHHAVPQLAGGEPPPRDVFDESDAVIEWLLDPVLFVRAVFGAEPDVWQAEFLRGVVDNLRVGASACKGPGKTCVEAWTIWWFEYCHTHAQTICTSITGDNLKDNLWKELAYWYGKSAMLQRAFEVKGERITHREHPKTWWVSARTWPQDADATRQANSLAGFHGENVMMCLDEMGDYPDGVVQAAEGIFANQTIAKARLIAAWNPTRTNGPAYRACNKDRKRWKLITITGDPDDPKRSPRISLEWARQMIEDWGRDSDVVRINVLGLFPLGSVDTLLTPDDILTAERRSASESDVRGEAIIYGLDVARFGDDTSRLRRRQGCVAFRGHTFRKLDGPTLAQRVAAILLDDEQQFGRKADALFVDVTGSSGASPYDHLRLLGFGDIVFPVEFAGHADDPRYLNKRAEIWHRAAKWVRAHGCLPSDSAELGAELCAPWFKYKPHGKRTVFVLQPKEEMKEKLNMSPDDADAFCLTFTSETIVPRDYRLTGGGRASMARVEYDPYASEAST